MLTQLVANGLIAGVVVALLAVGFAVLYSGSRFFVFTFGASYAWAAYTVLGLIDYVPRWIAIGAGILVGIGIGVLLEQFIYRPIRRRGSSPLILMLASIGAYTVLQNVISMVFGDETRSLRGWHTAEGHLILGARVTDIQLTIVGVSILVLTATWLLLKRTLLGRRLRAVANDELLARVVGIHVERAVLSAAALGSGLAAIAGVLMSLDTSLIPTMGFQALLLGVVAAIVGGVNSVGGAVLGGMLLGLAQHVGVWKLPTQWQDAIVFVILVVFLIVRPQGLFGKPLRRAAV